MIFSSLEIKNLTTFILYFLLTFLILNCSGDKKNRENSEVLNSAKYEEMLYKKEYSRVLKELYPLWRNETADTFLVDAFLTIAASRKARFYNEAHRFDITIGIDAYNTIEKYEKVRINKYHHFFSAIYYYLSGDRQNALKTINIFLKQNISSDWKNDAKIFRKMFNKKEIKTDKIKNGFINIILKSFPNIKIEFDHELEKFAAKNKKQTWMAGPVLQNATFSNVLKVSDIILLNELDNSEIFREKISEIKVNKDSVYNLYSNYYNPLLLKNIAWFYRVLAQKFYQKILK